MLTSTLEVTPTRGKKDTLFTFHVRGAPILPVAKSARLPENMAILYIENPHGQGTARTVIKIDQDFSITLKGYEPRTDNPNRWLAFLFPWDEFTTKGDLGSTILAATVFVIDP